MLIPTLRRHISWRRGRLYVWRWVFVVCALLIRAIRHRGRICRSAPESRTPAVGLPTLQMMWYAAGITHKHPLIWLNWSLAERTCFSCHPRPCYLTSHSSIFPKAQRCARQLPPSILFATTNYNYYNSHYQPNRCPACCCVGSAGTPKRIPDSACNSQNNGV